MFSLTLAVCVKTVVKREDNTIELFSFDMTKCNVTDVANFFWGQPHKRSDDKWFIVNIYNIHALWFLIHVMLLMYANCPFIFGDPNKGVTQNY